MSDGAIFAALVGGIIFLSVAIVGVGAVPVYFVQRANCHAFGDQTNREVKWVRYTPISWECLTRTEDGKWIPTKNLREFGEAP